MSSHHGQQCAVRVQAETRPGQPALPASFAMQHQLANRRQRQPSNGLACKETESAADAVTAVRETFRQQAEASFGHGAADEAADRSQHLGLSSDGHTDLPRGQDAAVQSAADGATPSRSLDLELTRQQTLTPANGSADPESHVRRFSGFSSEWGHLLRMAGWLCEEVRWHAVGGQHGSVVGSRQAAEDHYKSVVRLCVHVCICYGATCGPFFMSMRSALQLQSNETALLAILAEANHRLTEPLVVGT